MASVTCHAQQDTSKKYRSYLVPTVLITYGGITTYTSWGQYVNKQIKQTIYTPGQQTKIDDYLVLSPAAIVYGLNAVGVKGKNNFRDRSVVLGTSFLIAYPLVFTTKELTNVRRPDGSTHNSFPSGHSAFAFACAEFMRIEYKDKSMWYGVAGYTAATTVAGLRIYNDRHWFSDVATGAGLGILSTTIAYRVQPWLSDKLFPNKKSTASLTPLFQQNRSGLSLRITF